MAYIGSIKEEVLDIPELSVAFISDIREIDRSLLEKRYNIQINDEDTDLEVLEKICQSRKYVVRGGDYDYDRCSFAIISDFKSGKLGQICLESVKDLKKLTIKNRRQEKDV